MSRIRVQDAWRYAWRLTPFRAGNLLKGESVWVLTPAQTIPERFRESQERRIEHYMTTHDLTARTKPDDAIRYYVTSGGVPIAWVTLDGQTHYAEGLTGTALRHQAAVRSGWPDKFPAYEG